ncbi:MAG: winged helix-turn-helix domain-containing protein [Pseudomonadota bacterium]
MAQDHTETAPFTLGPVSVIPNQNRLESGESMAGLEPKVMDVLCALAKAEGETRSRDSLIEEVWGVEFGADDSLSRAISVLRKNFRSLAASTDFIETVPKRGYRLTLKPDFAAPASTQASAEAAVKRAVRQPRINIDAPQRPMSPSWAVLLTIIAATTVVMIAIMRGGAPSEKTGAQTASLAVLPFEDLSDGSNQQYLVDGLSEELLTALSAIEGLKVPGRTSSFSFRDRATSAREMGASLGVDHLLEGSVRRQGDDIRISARLVRAADGAQVWASTFEGQTGDVFALQETMAERILGEIAPHLVGKLDGPGQSDSPTAESVQLYLQGKGMSASRKPEMILEAIDLLEQAVASAPDFAEAHAHLATVQSVSAQHFHLTGVPPDEMMEKAAASARLALDLDDTLATPYAVLGLKAASEADYVSAIDRLNQALALDPNHVDAIRWKSLISIVIGHIRESHRLLERAAEIDPQWYVVWQNIAFSNLYLEDYEGVFDAYNRALALGMNQIPGARDVRSEAAYLQGNPELAMIYWMSNFEGQEDSRLVQQRVMWETAGRAVLLNDLAAREIMETTYQSSLNAQGRPPPILWMPQLHLGNVDRVMDLLADTEPQSPEELYGFSALIQLVWEPAPTSVAFRNHPRFLEFAETHGLLSAWQKLGWPDECSDEPAADRPAYCP